MIYPSHMHLGRTGATPSKQRGATLIVALVMLVLLTLLSLSAMNSTTTSIQVVGNAQFREEANAAAQESIEKKISIQDIATSEEVVTFGAATYTVTTSSTCLNTLPVTPAEKAQMKTDAVAAAAAAAAAATAASTAAEIAAAETLAAYADAMNEGAIACNSSAVATDPGIVTALGVMAASGGSAERCYKENRNYRAAVNDTNTGASIIVHQGVYSFAAPADLTAVCP